MRWRKLPDGRDPRGRAITRYESDTGWRVEQRKRHVGDGADQRRSDLPRVSYVIFDPTGKQRVDTSTTVAGAKRAAEKRAAHDAAKGAHDGRDETPAVRAATNSELRAGG